MNCPGSTDGEEGAWVIGIDPSTGGTKFRAPLANSLILSHNFDGVFCQVSSPDGDNHFDYHSWPYSPIKIAGDGYAYLSYVTEDSEGTVKRSAVQPFTDAAYTLWDQLLADTDISNFTAAVADLDALLQATGQTQPYNYAFLRSALLGGNRNGAINFENAVAERFKRPCDRTGTTVTKLHFLRVGPNGSSTDVVVKQWNGTSSFVFTLADDFGYHITNTETGTRDVDIDAYNLITNADQGALYSWQARDEDCGDYSYTNGPTSYHHLGSCGTNPEAHLTTTSGGVIASDVIWNSGVSPDYGAVEPVLQLEDGSFAGRGGAFWDPVLLVFDASGQVKQGLPGYSPVMVTAGGGLIASGAAGGTYGFDAAGNSTGQLAVVPNYSFEKQAYLSIAESITVSVAPITNWSIGFGSMLQGNPTRNGTSIGVVDSMFGLPVFGLSNVGGDCQIPISIQPPALSGAAWTVYDTKRRSLLNSPSSILSQQCVDFFTNANRPDWIPARASFSIASVLQAVSNQVPYDGPQTKISMFDAGIFERAAVNSPLALSALRGILGRTPVCAKFITEILSNNRVRGATAWSQAAESVSQYAPTPAVNVYFNTNTSILNALSAGTVLHEALHNLTGLTDENGPAAPLGSDLLTFVGAPRLGPGERMELSSTGENRITKKLIEVGCAPR